VAADIKWIEAPLGKQHERKRFDCGEAPLNRYLQRYARQNHESGGAKTFIAAPTDNKARVLGYYTLCPGSLDYARTPKIVSRGLGRYDVPVYRLGRLAIDVSVQGRGLGGELLVSAGRRCLAVAEQVGGVGLLIDAKSARAAEWYRTYGAVALEDAPLSLILPLATVAGLV
jgi:GNAT superfamily N-acetyltransferase